MKVSSFWYITEKLNQFQNSTTSMETMRKASPDLFKFPLDTLWTVAKCIPEEKREARMTLLKHQSDHFSAGKHPATSQSQNQSAACESSGPS